MRAQARALGLDTAHDRVAFLPPVLSLLEGSAPLGVVLAPPLAQSRPRPVLTAANVGAFHHEAMTGLH